MAEQVEYGGYLWRKSGRGYFVAYLPGHKKTHLHRFVYEREVGPIPPGMIVHHADGDKGNNARDNLVLLTRSDHNRWHKNRLSEAQCAERRQICAEKATPAAAAHNRSPRGREHQSLIITAVRARWQPSSDVYTCRYCGAVFTKQHMGRQVYCSPACCQRYWHERYHDKRREARVAQA